MLDFLRVSKYLCVNIFLYPLRLAFAPFGGLAPLNADSDMMEMM